jgi:hypothetical protein
MKKKYNFLVVFVLFVCVASLKFYYQTTDAGSDASIKLYSPKTDPTPKQEEVTRFDYVSKHKGLLDCRLEYKLDESKNKRSNVTELNSNLHGERIVRAILVYYPNDQFEDFKLEFKWFFRSWIEMQKYEPSKWRTDIVVFFDADKPQSADKLKFFTDLNCTYDNQRKGRKDTQKCVLVQYKALSDRFLESSTLKFTNKDTMYEYFYDKYDAFSENSNEFHVRLKDISHYVYLDSILMAFDGFKYLKDHYDFLIRSGKSFSCLLF